MGSCCARGWRIASGSGKVGNDGWLAGAVGLACSSPVLASAPIATVMTLPVADSSISSGVLSGPMGGHASLPSPQGSHSSLAWFTGVQVHPKGEAAGQTWLLRASMG